MTGEASCSCCLWDVPSRASVTFSMLKGSFHQASHTSFNAGVALNSANALALSGHAMPVMVSQDSDRTS